MTPSKSPEVLVLYSDKPVMCVGDVDIYGYAIDRESSTVLWTIQRQPKSAAEFTVAEQGFRSAESRCIATESIYTSVAAETIRGILMMETDYRVRLSPLDAKTEC